MQIQNTPSNETVSHAYVHVYEQRLGSRWGSRTATHCGRQHCIRSKPAVVNNDTDSQLRVWIKARGIRRGDLKQGDQTDGQLKTQAAEGTLCGDGSSLNRCAHHQFLCWGAEATALKLPRLLLEACPCVPHSCPERSSTNKGRQYQRRGRQNHLTNGRAKTARWSSRLLQSCYRECAALWARSRS